MLRNLSRSFLIASAGWLAATAVLSAQATSGLRGDVDGDGRITTADARIVADYLVGRSVPSPQLVAQRADVNGDGRVTSVDVAIINSFAAGRDVSRFRVGSPAAPMPENTIAEITCRADAATRTIRCGAPDSPDGARSIIVGNQHQYVDVLSSNLSVVNGADTADWTFDVTVKNLLVQALGTTNRVTADPDSVRVFFAQEPTATAGSGEIRVVNPRGLETFTATNQIYYQFSAPLDSGQVSAPVNWHFKVPNTATSWQFKLYVSAAVQFPKGWIDIYPPNHSKSPYFVGVDTVSADPAAPNHTVTLTDTVRNEVGLGSGDRVVTWSNPTPSVLTVGTSSGLVTGVSDGVDTVTASNVVPSDSVGGVRTGRVVIVVSTASLDSSTITAAPSSLPVGDSSTITVQLRNAAGANLTRSGGTVVLNASNGATITAVTNNNNGTYTAKVTHTVADSVAVTGQLNGQPLGDTAIVVFQPGAAASMTAVSALVQSTQANTAVAAPPEVKVVDALNNPVPNVTVTFTVAGSRGTVSNGGPGATSTTVNTNGSGLAQLTSWTVGTVVGIDSVTASASGVNSVVFTDTVKPGPAANMVKSAGDGQTAVVNNNVPIAPAVTITDSYGNPVGGVSVTFTPVTGSGSVTGGTATTNASGVAAVGSWKLGTVAKLDSLTATSTGLTAVTFTATATPDVPANITKLSTDPQNGTVGSPVGSPPSVHVTDQHGNAVPGVTVNFAVTGGGGSTTGASQVTNASGNATIGSWTPGSTAPGPNTLSATAVGGSNPSTTFTVYVPPVAGNDSSQVMGNTPLTSDVAPNVLANDAGLNGDAVTISNPGTPITTVRNGSMTVSNTGAVTYTPPAGNVLRDSAQYTVTDGHATASAYVKFRFVGKVWYIDSSNGGAADGRKDTPFPSVTAAEAVAGVNDSMLVRGSGATTGGTLKNGQLVYGQGSVTPFTTTLNGNTVVLLTPGGAPQVGALSLASGNTLRGFTSTGGLSGASIGTLTVGEVAVNNASGQALALSNGTLAGSFSSVQSAGGTNNISLTNVATVSVDTLGKAGDALAGATGDGVVISGGGGSFVIPGNISNTASLVVNVNGKTGGSVLFSGNLNPSVAGRGISVTGNNSGSNSIFFTGTKAISSAATTGVNLSNNTGATISFLGGNLVLSSTTGTAFSASGGGTVEVSGGGNTVSVTGAAARAVDLNGIAIAAGGMTFASIGSSGTTTASAFRANNVSGGAFATGSITVAGTTGGTSRGIELTSNSAPFTFTTASVNGTGGEGIYLTGNTGAVAVNGGTVGNTTSTTGDALLVSAGNAGVTVAASLTKSSAGRIANIASRTGGATSVSGNLSCTGSCTGVLVNGNTAGSVDFSGATKTLTTGSNTAVSATSNAGSTVSFTGGGLAISTSSGTGFNATGGGTVEVTGANNTVASSAGGRVVNIQNTNIGAGNVTFRSVNGTGSAAGVRVENTGASGGFKVTGDGSTASSGGIITMNGTTAADSAAFSLTNTASVSLEFVRVEVTTGSGAGGIAANNLSGTNLVRNSVFDYNGTAADAVPLHNAYGIRVVQNNANATINLDGVSINGTRAGSSAGVLSAQGSSVVNFNVIDSNTGDSFQSLFTDLFGSGWVIGAGDNAGSTATVNLTVSDSRFTNAAANGTNNLEMTSSNNGTLNYKIKNNTFQNVANASCICGIVNVNTAGSGVFGGTTAMDSIVGNTITNSGIGTAVTDLGYIPIRIAFDNSAATTNRAVIASNIITDSWRQGILLSTRQQSTGNFKVVNNTIGTAALPVGQSNRRGLETDLQDNSVMNLEFTGNNVTGAGTADAAAAVGIRVGTNAGSATLNATVLSNTIRSTSAGTTGRFRAESSNVGTGTMCLDLRLNNLEDNTKLYTLQQTGGTFRVEGPGTGAVTNANVQSANSGGTGNVTGTVLFNNNVNCQQPGL